jgi:tetratricopeptide (TPR) repeat protein
LTSYLTESPEFSSKGSERGAKEAADSTATATEPILSEATKQLELRLKSDPENRELMADLAAAYSEEAAKSRNVGLLVRAVDLYRSILKVDPANSKATLALALIMMDIGGYERAAELFEAYLKERPDDVRVRGDYSLALIQAERLDDAEKQLQQIIDTKQFLVQSHLSRALIMKLRGSKERVFVEIDAAAALAENDIDREKIDGFRAMLSADLQNKPEENGSSPRVVNSGSPAMDLTQYFQSHPIIGPKYKGVRWLTEKTAEIVVKEFPVEQMPPFARAKFVDSVSNMLSGLGEGFKVVLIDADSGKELISIP